MLCIGTDGSFRVWDTITGENTFESGLISNYELVNIVWHPFLSRFAILTASSTISIFSVMDMAEIRCICTIDTLKPFHADTDALGKEMEGPRDRAETPFTLIDLSWMTLDHLHPHPHPHRLHQTFLVAVASSAVFVISGESFDVVETLGFLPSPLESLTDMGSPTQAAISHRIGGGDGNDICVAVTNECRSAIHTVELSVHAIEVWQFLPSSSPSHHYRLHLHHHRIITTSISITSTSTITITITWQRREKTNLSFWNDSELCPKSPLNKSRFSSKTSPSRL